MANTKANVSTGKPAVAGAIYRGLIGENLTIPTDATTSLDTDFKCLGYVSEDGLTNSMSGEKEEIKAWGGDPVLVTNDNQEDQFKFTLLEVLNEDVLKAVYVDENVTVVAATTTVPKHITIVKNGAEQPYCAWVVEMLLQGDNPKRIVIPKGKISEVGEIVYKDDEAIGYEITISAAKDDNGNTHYEYLSIGDVVPSGGT